MNSNWLYETSIHMDALLSLCMYCSEEGEVDTRPIWPAREIALKELEDMPCLHYLLLRVGPR